MTLREWATPLTMGSFALIAVTGILMFFHLDTGLNKLAHEWLGWGLVSAVLLHAAANLTAFTRYFSRRAGVGIVGACLVVLALSFASPPGDGRARPPHVLAVQALLDAPVDVAARVAGRDPDAVQARLRDAGIAATRGQSLRQIGGEDREGQMRVLGVVFGN